MVRLLASALLCVICSSAHACDVMRPCYLNGSPLFASSLSQDSLSGHRATGHRTRRETHRRIPEGLARVMAEGAGRAVGIVRSVHGASARVASRATGAFQCLVSALDRQGYPIRFMGGYRAHGSVRHSLHPMGLALDINQYGRNRTQPRMPANEVALANSCGLISGAQWASRDSGHFQLGGWSGGNSRRGARGRLHRRR
ncbi:MAG: M15 family metallopeptidase [Rhizobiales bacterium]|nr:M15 family metallopeptidase [Hyphomicrobiales bacterium]